MNKSMNNYDVYAYGVISSSTLHILKNPFPAPDGGAEIDRTYPMTGGEALNSSIVLSKLGLRIFLDGNWIGDNAGGRALIERIQAYNIDTTRLRVKKGYSGVNEIVFSDEQSRTIFGNYIDLLFTTRKWNIPRKTDMAGARIVCIDPFFHEESAQAGKYAHELGLTYVTIDCRYDRLLSIEASANILSDEFRSRDYPQADLLELFSEYQTRAKGLVIFTYGGKEILYGRKGVQLKRFIPYSVKVVDSAGAGDAFRAGIVYGMLKGLNDADIIRYAAALAAMVCQTFPGVLKSPTHRSVMRFIREQEESLT